MTTNTIILLVLIIIIILLTVLYNSLITLKNRVQEAWSDINVQLKRRYDLIPNLVSTVKGYLKHEEGVLTKVTAARSKAMSAQGTEEKAEAENMLSGTLKSLFALSESYPDLKANTNFLQLQDEISDTENKIQAARRFYNGQVRDFNTKVQVFPNNLIAKSLGFNKFSFFKIENKEKENIDIKF